MLKSKLVTLVGRQQDDLSEQDIALGLNMMLDKMILHLSEGGHIEIRGFGSFCLHYRAPRQAHNPRTGKKLMTLSKYAVRFKPGKKLKLDIDASKHTPLQHFYDDSIGD